MKSPESSSLGFETLESREMMAILVSPQIVSSQTQVSSLGALQAVMTDVRSVLDSIAVRDLADRPDLQLETIALPAQAAQTVGSIEEQLAAFPAELEQLEAVQLQLQGQHDAIQAELTALSEQQALVTTVTDRLNDLLTAQDANPLTTLVRQRYLAPLGQRFGQRLTEIQADLGFLALESDRITASQAEVAGAIAQLSERRDTLQEQLVAGVLADFEADFESVEIDQTVTIPVENITGVADFDIPAGSEVWFNGSVRRGPESGFHYGISIDIGDLTDGGLSRGVAAATGSASTYIHQRENGRNIRNQQAGKPQEAVLELHYTAGGDLTGRVADRVFTYDYDEPLSQNNLRINLQTGLPLSGTLTYTPAAPSSRTENLQLQLRMYDNQLSELQADEATMSAYDCYIAYAKLRSDALAICQDLAADLADQPEFARSTLEERFGECMSRLEAIAAVCEDCMKPALEALYQETARPSISVVSTDPRRVVFHVMNPGEGSRVQLQPVSRFNQPQGMWGELAVRDFDHNGGTSHLIDMVAANVALNTDGYNLVLLDKQGAVLDSVFIPAANGNMTGADPRDRWDAHQYLEQCDILSTPDAAAMLNMTEPMPAMDHDIFMHAEEQMMDQVTTGELYNGAVPSLPSVLVASREMLHTASGLIITDQQKNEAMFRLYPALNDPALMQAEYDAMIASRPTFSAGSSIEKVNDYYRWITNQFSEAHNRYNEHMRNTVLPTANTVIQQAAQGQDTAAARQSLRDAIGELGYLQANLLQGQVPFAVPDEQQVLDIGCDLYFSQTEMFRHFVEEEADIRERYKDARVLSSLNGVVNPDTSELMASYRQVLAQVPTVRMVLAEQELNDLASDVATFYTSMSADVNGTFGDQFASLINTHSDKTWVFTQDPAFIINLRESVTLQSPDSSAIQIFDVDESSQMSVLLHNAQQLLYNLYQTGPSSSSSTQYRQALANQISFLTGIPTEKLFNLSSGSTLSFENGFHRLLRDNGYQSILNGNPSGVYANLDEAGDFVELFIDEVGTGAMGGKKIEVLVDGAVVNTIEFSARQTGVYQVPVSDIQQYGEQVQLRVRTLAGNQWQLVGTSDYVSLSGNKDQNDQNSVTLQDLELIDDYDESFNTYHPDSGDIYHLGADYSAADLEGKRLVWAGPTAKVVSILGGDQNGYGTMAIMLEIELPNNVEFQTEVFPEDLAIDSEEESELAKRTTVITNKIRIVIGHLRPSQIAIENEDADERYRLGVEAGDLSIEVGDTVGSGSTLGFFESTEYGGNTTGPHGHVTAYDANGLTGFYWNGTMLHNDQRRQYFIRPEDIWSKILLSNE